MKKAMFAALVITGLIAAANAQVNFDRGIGMNEVISQAVNTDLAIPAAPAAARGNYSRDCARFSFGPSDNEMLTEKVYLRSTEYETVCHTVMVPGPNGTQVPQQNCYERPGMTWHQYGQIKMNPRKLFPWERESFEICLRGPWLDLYANAVAYTYSAKREGNYDTLFVLTAKEKKAMSPDENGINLVDFSFADGKFTLKASDKWAAEYAGEKVAIKVELYKDNALFFDTFKGEKEFSFDPAEGYEMSFTESDLVKPAVEDNDGYRGAKKYFVKWGFKRLGAISKDTFVKKGKTASIEK